MISDNSKADLYESIIYPKSWARYKANSNHRDFSICKEISASKRRRGNCCCRTTLDSPSVAEFRSTTEGIFALVMLQERMRSIKKDDLIGCSYERPIGKCLSF